MTRRGTSFIDRRHLPGVSRRGTVPKTKNRKEGEPHPFVDSETYYTWLEELLVAAEVKLLRETAAGNP